MNDVLMRYRLQCPVVLCVVWIAAALGAPQFATVANANPASGETSVTYDRFGGISFPIARGTGFFCLRKVTSRWLMVTPDGDPFWMRSVYAVDWNDGGEMGRKTFDTKYHGDAFAFASHVVSRLRDWGFNTLGEYSSPYALPVPTYFRPRGNPERMPFIRFLNISWYGAINRGRLAPAPFKTLLAGAVDASVYHDWPGHVPDVFDPNFEIYAKNLAADLRTASSDTVFTERTSSGGLPQPSLVDTPWLVGTTPDDSDNLFGFGPGPDDPGQDGVIHPHIGWIIAVTRPFQSRNTDVGAALGMKQTVEYQDSTVYAKRAWRDFLQRKYGTIDRLNSAWGSSYTTFDSDGGWPSGRGLLDESGRHRWIGDDATRLSTATPAVVADLNAFLAVYAERYFRIVHDAVRAATPHQLVFSPAVLNSHEGLTRPQILQAAGRYCDALQIDADPSQPGIVEKTYAITGKPMFVWLGFKANRDSPIPGSSRGILDVGTQSDRGTRYARAAEEFFSHRTPDGTFPLVGLDWWEYMDKLSEEANWGLVTPLDNAYDGKEDVVARGRDAEGFPIGGENHNFGDFLSAVVKANAGITRQLADELGTSHRKQPGSAEIQARVTR